MEITEKNQNSLSVLLRVNNPPLGYHRIRHNSAVQLTQRCPTQESFSFAFLLPFFVFFV